MFANPQVLRLRVLLVAGLIAIMSFSVRQAASAQASTANEWTWMGGSSTNGSSGVYGTLGVYTAGNIPGGRYGASSWTDSSGHLWLFGGWGFDSNGNGGSLNDLWEFNPAKNKWAWMGGSSTGGTTIQPGVYGTLGTPAATNIPGGREYASSWTDSSGNLWLFGGWGSDANGNWGDLNDLWEFNPSNNKWAWMGGNTSGNQPGVYGTLRTPATTNIPGGRYAAACWTDLNGKLWLFGGDGYDANGNWDQLNDLWEFNPSTNQWAWMGGSSTGGTTIQPGVYGTLGEYAAGDTPGGRTNAVSWTDSSGHLWLLGGQGYDANGTLGLSQRPVGVQSF